jgi:hypothetical protein
MADGIRWINEGPFELGYRVVFARGLEPLELVARLGADLISHEPMSWRDANSYESYEDDIQVIRAGSDGDWAFAVAEYGSLGKNGTDDDVVCLVSAGTKAVSYSRTVNFDTWFSFARDGRMACCFEPGFNIASHTFPGELTDELSRAGLLADEGPDDAWERTLDMGETEFSLSLPRHDLVDGLLLAARITR